jgi:hypothetical protein
MNFENLSYLGSLFSGIAALIGISVAWFQLRGMKKSLEHSNLMSIFEIEFELGRKKERYAIARQQVLQVLSGRTTEKLSDNEKSYVKTLDDFVKEAEEDYFNVFDRICEFIVYGKLDEKDFRLAYRDMLFDTIESNREKFNIVTRYRNMVKLYGDWKEK